MSTKCTKCQQFPPHQSDSWCLGCTAGQAISQELLAQWGSQAGTRAVALDVLCSTVRQPRGLRRLSLAGAGGSRAPRPAEDPKTNVKRECSAAPSQRAPLTSEAPKEVKEEDEESEESETESSDTVEKQREEQPKRIEKTAEPLAPAATAKVKPEDKRSRSRREEVEKSHSRAGSGRARERRERSATRRREKKDKKEHRREGRESERPRSSRGWKDPEGGERRREPRRHHTEKPKEKKTRRAGAKHQRLYRAAEDPYRRFHTKPREGFWDSVPTF